MKLYIAVLDEFPDYMTPTLVAHAMLGAHLKFVEQPDYRRWLNESFKKCVLRVNRKEFDRIAELPLVYLCNESRKHPIGYACAVVCPRDEVPNVLTWAKLWKPKAEVE